MELANTFQNIFDKAVSPLNLQCDKKFLVDTTNFENPIDVAIVKFKNHPSIVLLTNI